MVSTFPHRITSPTTGRRQTILIRMARKLTRRRRQHRQERVVIMEQHSSVRLRILRNKLQHPFHLKCAQQCRRHA